MRALVIVLLATLVLSPAPAQLASKPIDGSIGSVVLAKLSGPATASLSLPTGMVATNPSVCGPVADEAKGKLGDYGTTWLWSNLDAWQAAGMYLPGQNTIILSTTLDCQWVPVVVVHEWLHQVQDITNLHDDTVVNGYRRSEYVAECGARVIADHYDWPHYKSYPELGGIPCSEFQADVNALLSTI